MSGISFSKLHLMHINLITSPPPAPPYPPPYRPDSIPPAVVPSTDFSPDYDEYSPAGGSTPGFRGSTRDSYSQPDGSYPRPDYRSAHFLFQSVLCFREHDPISLSFSIGGFYPEVDFGSPDGSPIQDPSLRIPQDPQAGRGFGTWHPPPQVSRPDGAPLAPLAPLPGRPHQSEEEEDVSWRPGPPFPPFPPFPDRSRGGAPRRVYESEASLCSVFENVRTSADVSVVHQDVTSPTTA